MDELLRSNNSVEDRNAGPSVLRQMYDAAGDGAQRASGLSMLDRDAPDHSRLRKLVAGVFTPRSIAALEPRVIELVDAALDRIVGAGQADLIEELAYPLPFVVISELLGMPEVDQVRLREPGAVLARSFDVVTDPGSISEIDQANQEMIARIAEMVAAKRRTPGEDLLTALITTALINEEGGGPLCDAELTQVVLLSVAGHETTVSLIANGTVALLRNPEQAALLRGRPDLDVGAVDELLRYDSPVQMGRRITLRPYEVSGREIPAGTFVVAILGSANRDEVFWGPDAGCLWVDRPNAKAHLSFGGGPHHCLGAALARLQGRIAITRLLGRFPALTLDGAVTWNGRLNLRLPAVLPVTVR